MKIKQLVASLMRKIRIIQSTRFADILVRNTNISAVFCSAMFVPQNFDTLDCGPAAYRPNTGDNRLNGSLTGINGNYQISWNVNPVKREMAIVMRARTAGWVGFGIPDPAGLGGMIGGDAYIGWIDAQGNPVLSNYDLLSRIPACVNDFGICVKVNGTNLITAVSGNEINGWTTIQFTRPLASNFNYEIVQGLNRILYAFGPTKMLSRHGLNLGRTQISFFGEDCLPAPGDYDNNLEFLDGNYQLYYSLDLISRTISVAIAGRTQGWVGIGVSPGNIPNMGGSLAVVGYLIDGTTPFISAWNLNGRYPSLVVVARDPPLALTATNVCSEAGFTVVAFTTSIDDWGILTDDLLYGGTPDTPIVVALSLSIPTSQDQLVYHGRENRVGHMIDFVLGESEPDPYETSDEDGTNTFLPPTTSTGREKCTATICQNQIILGIMFVAGGFIILIFGRICFQ